MKTLLLFFLAKTCSAVFLCCYAQSNFTGWIASFNTIKIGKKTSLHTDIQLRSTDEIKQVQTFLIRPGINFHLKKNLTVTAGYAFIHNKRVVGNVNGFAPEHRIWQQLLITHKWKKVSISHRFRLEQRFIAKTSVVNNTLEKDGSVYANRFRYFIRGLIPFNNEPVLKKGIFGALQNEAFLNFGNTNTVNNEYFDQNRLYFAIGYRLHSKFDLEAGYMNQYINGRAKAFTNNHILQLAGYMRL
jgi:hypothetical protein